MKKIRLFAALVLCLLTLCGCQKEKAYTVQYNDEGIGLASYTVYEYADGDATPMACHDEYDIHRNIAYEYLSTGKATRVVIAMTEWRLVGQQEFYFGPYALKKNGTTNITFTYDEGQQYNPVNPTNHCRVEGK